MSEQVKLNGIVLKAVPYKNSKLLTILTDKRGLISAFANGTNSTKSKLLSASEQFSYSEFVLFDYKDKLTINSADVIDSFFDIRKDLFKLSLLTYFGDITADLSPIEDDAEINLELFIITIKELINEKIPRELIKAIYELKMLSISGFMPDLERFGQYKPDYLNSIQSESVIKAMKYITNGDIDKIYSFIISKENTIILNSYTERMLKETLEKEYKSLDFYRSLL